MKLSLEKRLFYSRNPHHYFNDVDGSKDRWRNYLERSMPTEVGRHYRHPSAEVFEPFLKKDGKKHYSNNVRDYSPQTRTSHTGGSMGTKR